MTARTDTAGVSGFDLAGFAAAFAVMLIWSSWLVVSRSGALSPLTPYDLAALRYGVSGIIALPIVLWLKPWRSMPLFRIGVLTILLGPIYILLVFAGFEYAPAAHGGIFMNGAIPVMTLALGWLWLSERATAVQLISAAVIFVAVAVIVWDTDRLALAASWRGDAMFLGAGLFFSAYMLVSRAWAVTPAQLILCGAVLNALIYLPVWYWALPSHLGEVSSGQLAIQTVCQGLIPNLLGLLLVGVAAQRIGPSATSAVMAGVPGMGAILSFAMLGETLGPLSWAALAVLTAGIFAMAVTRNA